MDTAAVAKLITELEFLSEMPLDERKQVAELFLKVSDILSYEDGESLIIEGYLAFDTGYVLVEGKAMLELKDGEPFEINAPALLGEMAQFRSDDVRVATARASGRAAAAQFNWRDLYRAADAELSGDARIAFSNAVERQIWARFESKEILELPLLADLDEDLRLKVCMPFPSLAERVHLQEIDTLFNQGSRCKNTGYLLVGGKVRLLRKEGEKICQAPDIIGIFPNKGETGSEWTASAMANGYAELLKFSWDEYTAQLLERLSRDEQEAYVASLKKNASKHFWH